MNTSINHQISEDRHKAALETFLIRTTPNTQDAADYAKDINDRQWEIVAKGVYNMDDAFVLAVEGGA